MSSDMIRLDLHPLLLPLCLLAAAPAAALELEVRASGRGDAPIRDLEAASFSLKEGGKDREIESFRFVDDVTQTKIYIAVEVLARDFPRVQNAIEKFIDEKLPEGVEVSLGGSPFTSDSAKLREWLQAGTSLGKDTPSAGMERLWQADSALQIQGQPVLMRYHRLAAQLSATPGSKAVVLFRNHLDLDRSGLNTAPTGIISTQRRQNDSDVTRNQALLQRFGSQSLFARVSFYPADVDESSSFAEQGLNGVANVTDGRSLLGVAEVGRIFDMVLEDAASYYVLGYTPELEGKGRLVSLRLGVDRKGVDLRFTKNYLDIPSLIAGPAEGPGAQSSAMDLSPEDATLEVSSAYAFFRGDDGNPIAIVSGG